MVSVGGGVFACLCQCLTLHNPSSTLHTTPGTSACPQPQTHINTWDTSLPGTHMILRKKSVIHTGLGRYPHFARDQIKLLSSVRLSWWRRNREASSMRAIQACVCVCVCVCWGVYGRDRQRQWAGRERGRRREAGVERREEWKRGVDIRGEVSCRPCTHARTHARTRARTHTHTHTHTLQRTCPGSTPSLPRAQHASAKCLGWSNSGRESMTSWERALMVTGAARSRCVAIGEPAAAALPSAVHGLHGACRMTGSANAPRGEREREAQAAPFYLLFYARGLLFRIRGGFQGARGFVGVCSEAVHADSPHAAQCRERLDALGHPDPLRHRGQPVCHLACKGLCPLPVVLLLRGALLLGLALIDPRGLCDNGRGMAGVDFPALAEPLELLEVLGFEDPNHEAPVDGGVADGLAGECGVRGGG